MIPCFKLESLSLRSCQLNGTISHARLLFPWVSIDAIGLLCIYAAGFLYPAFPLLFPLPLSNLFLTFVFHTFSRLIVEHSKMPTESRVENPLVHPFLFGFQIYQYITSKILSPAPPDPSKPLGRPKIAIIGAGITGVSAAAHCVGHGFDVVIFEAGGEKNLGGIWSVSKTDLCSSLYLGYKI